VSGYVWPLPREYDLLIVRGEAKPCRYTRAYNIDDVFFIIEVKARGMFPEKDGKEKGLKRAVDKLAKNLKEPITKFKKPHVKLACLLIGEAVPKREVALKWTKKVREFMKEHNIPVFILSNTRAKTPEEAVKPFKREWKKFVKYIVKNLPKT